MRSETIYRKKERLPIRRLGSELMLYDQETDKVHVLNKNGVLIWELLDGKNTLFDIENIFIKQFPDTKPEEISKDIKEVIEKLESEGLICC